MLNRNYLAVLAPAARRGVAIGLLAGVTTAHAQYATAVVDYSPGTGYATEFGSGLGYTRTDSALGEPSRITPGEFGGPVDPFSGPYLREQLLSIGTGGSLTVALAARNDPANPYGLDFQVFGGAFFVIVNGDYSGGGLTDGSRFGHDSGETRVSISADGISYYVLQPRRGPGADGVYPTLGAGDFQVPVNPSLRGEDFAGLGLAGISLKYQGSGGGTGYDIEWAQRPDGTSADLSEITHVRIEVLSGRMEVDALAAVRAVPEPSTWALLILGAGSLLAVSRRPRTR